MRTLNPKPCALVSNPAQPLPIGESRLQGQTLTLIHDITIGGERMQEVELSCTGTPSTNAKGKVSYYLRFSLSYGIWKAKSATPTGSHSRFETN